MMCTESFPVKAWEVLQGAETHPHVIGDFVLTAFYYLGETGTLSEHVVEDYGVTFLSLMAFC